VTEKKIQIKNSSGETLVGIEVLPEKGGKFPVVVMAHGFAYFKEEDGIFVEVGKRLAEIGTASYRFDFSGCGESEGDYSKTTLSKLRDDLNTILEYVKQRQTTDVEKIGIFAQSFGTTTTIALSPKIKSVILMGSFMNGHEILRRHFGSGYNPNGISTRTHDDGRITKMEPSFWKDFEKHNMKELLKNMHASLLLIHGSKDDIVALSSMEKIYEVANAPKEKVIIQGADHGLEPKREEMYKVVVDWFKKTL
jgi:fermentation-respiration switch protein FrsA (DUF1100 family)